jgi:hypothetical protein
MAVSGQDANPWAKDLDLLPKFAIRKIVISEDRAVLSCALQRPRNLNYENWIGSSEFNSYIKYYFIAAPKIKPSMLGAFYFEDKRVVNIYKAVAPNRRDYYNWELGLGPQRQRDLDHDHGNPFNLKGYTKLSLEEILQGQYFAKDPLTATESIDPIDPYIIDNAENQNTSFSVEIELLNNPFGEREEELNILAFAQLDVQRIKEDFGLAAVQGLMNLMSVGSPLIYEKCMIRDEAAFSNNNNFIVPNKRKIFFLPDGSAYSGPVHYRSPEIAGPRGYVGWVAGPYQEREENIANFRSRQLTMREVDNTKVVSKISMQRMLNHDGLVISQATQERAYFGFVGTPSIDNTPAGSLVFGDEIARTLQAQMGHLTTLGENTFQSYQERMRELAILSLKRGQLNLTNTAVPPGDLSWVNIEDDDMFHGSVFMLKLDEIISANSRMGHLYEMHKRAVAARDLGSDISSIFMQQVIKHSRIYDFSVYRRRITNLARGSNRASSSDYEVYDVNDSESFVIRTTGPNNPDVAEVIVESSNDNARIFQHNAQRGSAEPEKIFILEDRALFRDYHTGRYEYIIDITVEDGILKEMERIYIKFKQSLRNYIKYVEEASRPYLDYRQSAYYSGNQFADGAQDEAERINAGTTGNYNYSTNQFTDAFIEKSLRERRVTDSIATLYSGVLHILTAAAPLTARQLDRIKDGLLAGNTNIEVLEYFMSLCMKLEKRFEAILGSSREPYDEMNLGIKVKKISKNTQYPQRLINLRGEAKVHAKAIDKNAVMVQPDNPRRMLSNARDPRRNLARVARIGSFMSLDTTIRSTEPQNFGEAKDEIGFNIITLADPSTATTAKEVSEMQSKIKASMEASSKTPPAGSGAIPGASDSLAVINGLLAKYGSTTIETLVKRAKDEEKSKKENKQEEDNRWHTSGFQTAIASSIVTADDSETFAKQTEEEYKDLYLKKERLKEMYDTVTSILAADKLATSPAVTYEEKVKNSTTTEDIKKGESTKDEQAAQDLKGDKFEAQVLESDNPETTTGVVVYKSGDESIKGATVVNNVTLIVTEPVEMDPMPDNPLNSEFGWK